MFLDCILGPIYCFGSRKKAKFPNQLLFCHNNIALWPSKDEGGGGQTDFVKGYGKVEKGDVEADEEGK